MSIDLQALQDRLDIEELTTRYAHGVDKRDWEAVHSCFHPDADVIGGTGRGKYKDYGANLQVSVSKWDTTFHFLANKATSVNGDTGHLRTYGMAYHMVAGKTGLLVSVIYNDDVVRTPDGWKIRNRVVETIWSHPLDENYKDLVPKT